MKGTVSMSLQELRVESNVTWSFKSHHYCVFIALIKIKTTWTARKLFPKFYQTFDTLYVNSKLL